MASARPVTCSLDVVCLAIESRNVVVLLRRGAGGSWRLPGAAWSGRPTLSEAAAALIREALPSDRTWHEQIGAVEAGLRSRWQGLSVVFVALVARGAELSAGAEWCDVAKLPVRLTAHHKQSVRAAVAHVRDRMDQAPVAFQLVPPLFTLSDLQGVYEVLLRRRLHKASFRRALRAAALVEAMDSWRSDGRGRPAQLFRYAPSRRRGNIRPLHLEMPDA